MTHAYDPMRELHRMAWIDGRLARREGRWYWLSFLIASLSIQSPMTAEERTVYAAGFYEGWLYARAVEVPR